MLVRDVMQMLAAVQAGESVAEGLDVARTSGTDHVLIFDGARLVGVSCACELELREPAESIGHRITRAPEVIWAESTLPEAARRFVDKQVGCFPVCEHDRVVGLVTRDDLLEAGLSPEDTIGGFCCALCGSTRHLRPLAGSTGRSACLACGAGERPAESPWLLPVGGASNQPAARRKRAAPSGIKWEIQDVLQPTVRLDSSRKN